MAFLRSDYWRFASRVELSKIILLLPRKEHSGYTIIFDFNVYLKVQRSVDMSGMKAIPKRLQMIRVFLDDISEDICFH